MKGGVPTPRLKRWRTRRALTQAELAAAAGVTRSTVIRAESGTVAVSFYAVRKLAAALGVSPEDLQEDESEPAAA